MVSQSIAPDFISAAAHQDQREDLLTLVRMEIGGLRFVAPLSEVAAVIEPTTMEPLADDEDDTGIWIGKIASRQGVISVASGPRLLRVGDGEASPGRLAILRAERPIGLAVDRVLGARAIERDDILHFPSTVAAMRTVPVAGAIWGEDDELELLLDVDALIVEMDESTQRQSGRFVHSYRQNIIQRYGSVDYRRALEVRFSGSDEGWLLPMSTVRLVTDPPEPHPLPRSPERVAGLLSWRRNPIPVIDPTYQLQIPVPVGRPAKLVVVGEPAAIGAPSESADAALLVSSVAGIQHNLNIEHGRAWGRDGNELRIMRLLDALS